MENKKLTVLMVDDDKFLLDMYTTKFSKNDAEVVAMPSTTEALRKLREGLVPDIMLLDMIMPGMDGVELLTTIRKEKLAPTSTIIMLTNQSQAEDREKAEKNNISGYIVKASTVPSEVYDKVMEIYHKHKK